uniref:Uncharacterized protein n=1 Tax=Lepeophtheirus salmonis TaxID=72036 RepID=A0A0K2UFK1_LEPSM
MLYTLHFQNNESKVNNIVTLGVDNCLNIINYYIMYLLVLKLAQHRFFFGSVLNDFL